ncbi:hypothetical protein [Brevibacterium salitolerans]|uniref:Uncharacterized protein n=1 Tax=Brevibacterium salitolerans TaxID=1403566 RepID=A0ABN2WIP4_9MICO
MTESNVETTEANVEMVEETEDQLLGLPVEKLAGMLREKRKAEASVRAKLRDVEAERDRLAGSVAGYQRQAFAEVAKKHRMHESALDDALGVVSMDEVLREDGTVDAEKAGNVLTQLRETKPHYFVQVPGASGGEVRGPGIGSRVSASWSEVLR